MKILRICALFLVVAASAPVFAKDGTTIRLATEAGYPPFSETAPDGSFRGLDIDIGNAICTQMKLRCAWVRVPWEDMIPAVISHKVDAIVASMSITEERKSKVDFTRKYYSSPLAVVAKEGSPCTNDPASLKGRKVGVVRGAVSDHYAVKFWTDKGVEVVRYRLQDEPYLDLVAGRLDAVLADYLQVRGGFLDRPQGKGFRIAGEKIYGKTPEERAVIGDGIGIAVRKKDQDLKRILDEGIAIIRANGTYDRIVRKYFSENIYGE